MALRPLVHQGHHAHVNSASIPIHLRKNRHPLPPDLAPYKFARSSQRSNIRTLRSLLSNATMSPPIHVLYGTVTGNAEAIATRIHSSLPSHSLKAGSLLSLHDYSHVKGFSGTHPGVIVIVVSTTGDGDPPDAIRPFMRLLRKKTMELNKLHYTVLALGDTNYENFCATGKRIDKALGRMGAVKFYRRGDADDGTGMDQVVEPWLKGLWGALKDTTRDMDWEEEVEEKKIEEVVKDAVHKVTAAELGFDEKRLPKLYPCKVQANVVESGEVGESVKMGFSEDVARKGWIKDARLLTSEGGEKEIWHMEIEVEKDLERKYRPGDAFAVVVQNKKSETERMLKMLEMSGDEVVEVERKGGGKTLGTARQWVSQGMDLRAVVKKGLLRALAECCGDVEDQKRLLQLSSRDGRKEYNQEIVKKERGVLRVLEDLAPSCRPGLGVLLEGCGEVAVRWYSAVTAADVDGERVIGFVYSVVKDGLATEWMADMCRKWKQGEKGEAIWILGRDGDEAGKFRPPEDLGVSYIMVGPGTGVAPFRGFLRERKWRMESEESVGETMLFFGCRREKEDFLYEDELKELEQEGVLGELVTAFSREGDKAYVQKRMWERKEKVGKMIAEGGRVYVCGDGGGMARDVHEMLRWIIKDQVCDGDDDAARSFMDEMVESARYVRDIWYFA